MRPLGYAQRLAKTLTRKFALLRNYKQIFLSTEAATRLNAAVPIESLSAAA